MPEFQGQASIDKAPKCKQCNTQASSIEHGVLSGLSETHVSGGAQAMLSSLYFVLLGDSSPLSQPHIPALQHPGNQQPKS